MLISMLTRHAIATHSIFESIILSKQLGHDRDLHRVALLQETVHLVHFRQKVSRLDATCAEHLFHDSHFVFFLYFFRSQAAFFLLGGIIFQLAHWGIYRLVRCKRKMDRNVNFLYFAR
jgi:hypothetical protein